MDECAAESGEPDAYIWFVNLMTFTHREAGRYDEALALLEPFIGTDTPVAPICDSIAAMLRCEAERHDEARAGLEPLYLWARELPRDQSYLPILGPMAIVVAEL